MSGDNDVLDWMDEVNDLRRELTAATARAEQAERERDALRAENERLTARVGVLRGVLASWMGHAMHSQEERKQAEAVLAETEGKQ